METQPSFPSVGNGEFGFTAEDNTRNSIWPIVGCLAPFVGMLNNTRHAFDELFTPGSDDVRPSLNQHAKSLLIAKAR